MFFRQIFAVISATLVLHNFLVTSVNTQKSSTIAYELSNQGRTLLSDQLQKQNHFSELTQQKNIENDKESFDAENTLETKDGAQEKLDLHEESTFVNSGYDVDKKYQAISDTTDTLNININNDINTSANINDNISEKEDEKFITRGKQRDEKNDELNKNTLGTPDKGEEIQEEEGIRWVVAEGQDPLSFTKLTLLCEGPKCNVNSQLECGYPWGPVDAGYRPNYDNYNRNNPSLRPSDGLPNYRRGPINIWDTDPCYYYRRNGPPRDPSAPCC